MDLYVSSQYRQKTNLYLHSEFSRSYGLNYSTWSFFESGHGKSVADGIGGCVKIILDRKVSYGADITCADDAYKILRENTIFVKVFLIEENEINKIQTTLPDKLSVLKGTFQLHQIITDLNKDKDYDGRLKVKYRDLSCFCGLEPGNCLCFAPQYHTLIQSDPVKTNMAYPSISGRTTATKKSSTPSSTTTKNTILYDMTTIGNIIDDSDDS